MLKLIQSKFKKKKRLKIKLKIPVNYFASDILTIF